MKINEFIENLKVDVPNEEWLDRKISTANALGWNTLPVELKYYDGGERIEDGVLFPEKLGI